MAAITAEKVSAALDIVRIVADCIKELGAVPSGHLYARLMPHMTFGTYAMILDVLTHGGLIKIENNVITWIGAER